MTDEPSAAEFEHARAAGIVEGRLHIIEAHNAALSTEVQALRDAIALDRARDEAVAQATARELAAGVESTRVNLAVETEDTRAQLATGVETTRQDLVKELATRKYDFEHLLTDKLFRTRRHAIVFGAGYTLLGIALSQAARTMF